MRLVEGVLGELEDVVPHLLGDLAAVAVAHGTVEPVVLHGLCVAVCPGLLDLPHEGDLLLGHGLADLVALSHGEAAHLDGDAHNLLLVDHGAVGVFQDPLEALVVVGDRGDALLAVDVVVDHAGAQGARAEERDGRHDVCVAVWLHALEQRGHAVGLDLEHAGGVARAHELEDLGILEVDLLF